MFLPHKYSRCTDDDVVQASRWEDDEVGPASPVTPIKRHADPIVGFLSHSNSVVARALALEVVPTDERRSRKEQASMQSRLPSLPHFPLADL
ncbi:unnamed protein product, partial [Chrysoparadoxa australica]